MDEEQLLDIFGELLCAITRTEKGIPHAAQQVIERKLRKEAWGEKALWSFNYESKHNRSVKEAYDRAIDAFTEFGPSDKYDAFFSIMEEVANRYAKTEQQKRIPQKLKGELIERLEFSAGESETPEDLEDE